MSKYKRRNKGYQQVSELEDVPHTEQDQADKAIKDYILKALRSGFKDLKPEGKETK